MDITEWPADSLKIFCTIWNWIRNIFSCLFWGSVQSTEAECTEKSRTLLVSDPRNPDETMEVRVSITRSKSKRTPRWSETSNDSIEIFPQKQMELLIQNESRNVSQTIASVGRSVQICPRRELKGNTRNVIINEEDVRPTPLILSRKRRAV